MKRLLSILAVAVCAAALVAGDTTPLKKPAQVAVDDLSGIWIAHGTEHPPDGDPQPYASIVTIHKHKDGYLAQWTAGPGANVLAILVRDGETITAAWISKGLPGVSIFKLDADGKSMSGKWQAFPGNTWHTEQLRRLAPLPVVKKVTST